MKSFCILTIVLMLFLCEAQSGCLPFLCRKKENDSSGIGLQNDNSPSDQAFDQRLVVLERKFGTFLQSGDHLDEPIRRIDRLIDQRVDRRMETFESRAKAWLTTLEAQQKLLDDKLKQVEQQQQQLQLQSGGQAHEQQKPLQRAGSAPTAGSADQLAAWDGTFQQPISNGGNAIKTGQPNSAIEHQTSATRAPPVPPPTSSPVEHQTSANTAPPVPPPASSSLVPTIRRRDTGKMPMIGGGTQQGAQQDERHSQLTVAQLIADSRAHSSRDLLDQLRHTPVGDKRHVVEMPPPPPALSHSQHHNPQMALSLKPGTSWDSEKRMDRRWIMSSSEDD